MTATRRLSTLLATLTAAIMLFASPAAAGLADRAEPATTGETVSIPVTEPRATTAVAAIQADVEEVAEIADKPATVKRAGPPRSPGFRAAPRTARSKNTVPVRTLPRRRFGRPQ